MARKGFKFPGLTIEVWGTQLVAARWAVWLLAACMAASLPAQDVTLRMDVKLVTLFVNVTDQNSAIVGGLTREDFAIA
ncbi:MAG: hypothetical protein KGM96_16690, partial [Acidobacteriota bacterium]|nr:hypothetical protein [Acidobacteriota bacterium]